METISKINLFENIPAVLRKEWSQTLFSGAQVKIERIVSKGHCSPPGFWYDQDWDEWVVLLKGGAGLCFEHDPVEMVLVPGDAVLIPARVRHRVSWTDKKEESVWLAVHLTAAALARDTTS